MCLGQRTSTYSIRFSQNPGVCTTETQKSTLPTTSVCTHPVMRGRLRGSLPRGRGRQGDARKALLLQRRRLGARRRAPVRPVGRLRGPNQTRGVSSHGALDRGGTLLEGGGWGGRLKITRRIESEQVRGEGTSKRTATGGRLA